MAADESERAGFETWARLRGKSLHRERSTAGSLCEYYSDSTRDSWEGWLAKAAVISTLNEDCQCGIEPPHSKADHFDLMNF